MIHHNKIGVVEVKHEDSFFEHGKTSMFMTLLLSASVRKKTLFYILSLLLCLFQMALLASDITFHFNLKNHHFPTYSHTEAILLFQVVNFYWAVLATTYSLQAGNKRMGYYSLASVFFNLIVFASRCAYEFMMLQFRAEEF